MVGALSFVIVTKDESLKVAPSSLACGSVSGASLVVALSANALDARASVGASPVSSPQAGKGVRVRASAQARNRDKSRRDHG